LTIDELRRICIDNETISIAKESMQNVAESRRAVDQIVADKHIAYGINTGFGKFSDVIINPEDVENLQLHLIRSHACGVGKPFPETVSSMMMVLRLIALFKGISFVWSVVIKLIL